MLIANTEGLATKRQAVAEIAEARLDEAQAAAFLTALDQYLDRASAEEFAAESAEEVYGACLALWKFAEQRKPGTPAVRVYNPAMAEHGWASSHTILEIVNDDMPFLVDSLTVLLNDRGLGIHALLHPILDVPRDAEGRRVAEGEAVRESVIQAQIDQLGNAAALEELEGTVRAMLADVRVAVRDWRPMLARLTEVTAALRETAPADRAEAAAESAAFLDWLAANHFTFLGCRRLAFVPGGGLVPDDESGLGLLADPSYTVMRDRDGNFTHWTTDMTEQRTAREPVLILKANRRATVHRGTHYDLVAVAEYDADGGVTGEHLFVGLFTSGAYNRSPDTIPLLREKIARVIQRAGYAPASHDGKALDNVLETFPRDELFQSTDDQLYENALGILQLVTRPRTRLFMREDRFGRFVSCMVFVPRDRYNTELRVRLGEILCEAVNGRVASWEPSFAMETMARVHFVVALTETDAPVYDVARIEKAVVEATRSWADRLCDALVERFGEHKGHRLHRRYGEAFPASYVESAPVAVALSDIQKLVPLSDETPLALHFYRRLEDGAEAVRFKIYSLGRSLALSACLPVLEHMGFRVLAEHPHKLMVDGVATWVHDFEMVSDTGVAVDLGALREKLEEGFAEIWAGRVDDDRMNRLVLLAGLDIRAVSGLRAYSRFLRQARIPYSIDYMEDALAEQPAIAADLVALFAARFDPAAEEGREERVAELTASIEAALDAVPSLDVDRILRRFLNALMATLRTNAFQQAEDGKPKPYLSFKFDSGKLDELPLPRPWREIFVYATWVEGVHLRGGPVARGGLRWSDRKEDYRTEILGLVKAQQVKNAVIVPVGSKGGFLPKRLPVGGSREEIQAEAIRCYRTFLSGLLDVTDNLVQGALVPPADVVRHDADDPYLVVAADKGTATFSDIANGLAQDYSFWLDDAFASGGSNGYDHKGMGITARGGWEAVKRHFLELGHDTQSEPFTVMGCGDMSGDVFGNGMLLSDQIRLIAAFDHRDIFFDPDPDPATSYAERKRLFEIGRSSWQDYDKGLIATGGGVFSRSAKSITLSEEMKAVLGVSEDRMAPTALIQAILRAKADLFWFGGIGTYVKAAEETALDVGDRANDAVRIDADEMGARVVGEGANLGVTQRGRIALARRGVKINTDAVDNSAGVDCSDHEVNIKIALGAVVQAGDMTEKQRNLLLAEMTDRVAELVLETNYAQTLAISMAEARAGVRLDEHVRLMRALEADGLLNRAVELLPDDEALAERAAEGEGLSRPEIAVLLAYAKLTLFDEIVASSLPDDPYLERVLTAYFPEALAGPHGAAIREHRLRREIIATVVANRVVNEGGIALVHRTREESGSSAGEIVEAFVVAREALGIGALKAEIDALDTLVPAAMQIQMHLALSDAVASQMACVLHRPAEMSAGALIERYGAPVQEIMSTIAEMLSDFSKSRLEERAGPLIEGGVPADLARRVAALEFMGGVLDVIDVAVEQERPVSEVAATYFAVGARFGLDWLRSSARGLETADHWEQLAVGRLIGDLRAQQSQIAAAALRGANGVCGHACIEGWAAAKAEEARRADRLMAEYRAGGELTVAKLAVAASQFRSVAAG